MPRGFKHTGNPSVEMGVYETIEDGVYAVNGIEEFVPAYLDEKGNPFFKENNGEMKVICKLRTPDGSEGPAFSATVPDFYAMIRAFGAEPDAKYSNRMSPGALIRAKDAANRAGRRVQVEVRNGYVRFLPYSATLPEGKYTVRFIDAHRRDWEQGNYRFDTVKGKNGSFESLMFDFIVVGDAAGQPTIWNGFKITEFFNNPFTAELDDGHGGVIRAEDEGIPLFQRDEKTGGEPFSVRNWETFIRYFAPDVEDHDWQTDPLESNYGINEVLEPQFVIINAAKDAKLAVKVFYTKKKNSDRMGISMRDIELLNDAVLVRDEPSSALEKLVDYIAVKWPEIQVFEDPESTELVFTTDGREWAKEYLGGENGPWVRSGLDLSNRAGLHTLSDGHLEKLLDAFIESYGVPAGW